MPETPETEHAPCIVCGAPDPDHDPGCMVVEEQGREGREQ